MNVEIVTARDRPIPAATVYGLHRFIGWWPERTEDDYNHVLGHSPTVGAWAGDELVGFARAISDGRLHAYVDDVMVHPDWRHRGIAFAVVDELVKALGAIPVVTLFYSADLARVYEKASFSQSRQVIMHRRPSDQATS